MLGNNPMPSLNPPLTITRAWLDQYGACKDQADLFEKLWPQGAVVTQDTLTSAARAGLSLEWLAEKVLPPALYAAYLAKRVPLLADYMAKHEVLVADYHAKRAPLLADYQAMLAPLFDDYLAERVPLLADDQAKREVLDADYHAKRAPMLAEYAAKDIPLYADYEARRNTLLIAALLAAGG